MAVDVVNYEGLRSLEQGLGFPDTEKQLATFIGGQDISARIGDGYEIDGLRDYEPGDDARHIDWIKTAGRSDGGLWIRQHYEDKAPLTVLVSDIPSDRYGRTPGDPMSSRALGFVSSHTLLRVAGYAGSPLIGYWSHGERTEAGASPKPVVYEGPKAPRKVIEQGLAYAVISTTETERRATESQQKRGLLRGRRSESTPTPTPESFAEVIDRARNRSQRIAETARFIVVSDFRQGIDETAEALRGLRRSDVFVVEVTNPALRELPQNQDLFSTSGTAQKGSVLIETAAQREEYARLARAKQARIDQILGNTGAKHIKLDTADLQWSERLKAIVKA